MRQLKIEQNSTDRTPTIRRYFNDVGNDPPLNSEEEYEIAVRAAAGDQEAQRELVKSNLRFVISVAKQYSRGGDSLSELIAQGNLGLIEAAGKFDPTRGFKFISFAVWFIRKEILLYLNTYSNIVRLPVNVKTEISRLKKAESKIMSELHREPTSEELMEELAKTDSKLSSDKLKHILASRAICTTPLESSNPDEEWAPIQWLESDGSPTDWLDADSTRSSLYKLLRNIDPTQGKIIELYYGLNGHDELSFLAIGLRFNKTAEWARQNYKIGMRKIISKVKNKKMQL